MFLAQKPKEKLKKHFHLGLIIPRETALPQAGAGRHCAVLVPRGDRTTRVPVLAGHGKCSAGGVISTEHDILNLGCSE